MNQTTRLIKLDSTPSTNQHASDMLRNGFVEEFTVIQTIEQTQGKGMHENKWESEKGKNLTCSIILHPDFVPADKNFYISQMFSLAVVDVISKYCNNVKIKWPNDIYVNNKKIAGILIENSLMGSSILNTIIGLGLNINQTKFVSDAPNPTSLSIENNLTYNIDSIRDNIICATNKYYKILKSGNYNEISIQYKQNLFRYKELATYKDKISTFEATIIDILPSGKLIIEKKDNSVNEYNFKEIEYIIS